MSHFPQVYPLVPGLKLLEEEKRAKFLTKTEQKNWKRIRKKKCSMDLVIVGVWWNNIKLLIFYDWRHSLAYPMIHWLVYPPKIYLPTRIPS